ncbi:1-phosphatidylinositol-3-phosphate 5-kinase FAB1A [Platanthera zijinensis]|uniref:1-phosphatidylinositol-3-phosphate 5-kinase FAB1A n=1 Tax=Platanthera zijinensis TaxID=2320716 RepID=A0AAP0B091_9ASPA
MLEKIGLPAKPSMRGSNWVIDASHCQGCSSPFTLFNRKHHCRRCGGIFCNSCTQQRMVLRGQGDSPVRICDPCKKLEEAARFEMRYGYKNRAAKALGTGSSKQILNTEDELVGEISPTDGNYSTPSGKEPRALSDIQETGNQASHSKSNVVSDSSNFVDGRNAAIIELPGSSPEDLRKQAAEEKKMYRVLKAEGKAEEALKAFKLGKELERQAGALEIAIRKNRRTTEKVSRVSIDRIDENEAPGSDKKQTSLRGKEVKDVLFTELRELGWSDAELHDAEKKSTKLSLEGELSNLLGEAFQKSEIGKKKGGIDKTQVLAHKRKALTLKREGKLAEAKEELKQAKILEKQLEEQEFLVDSSESEDELSILIHNMDDDDRDDLMLGNSLDAGADFKHLLGDADDLPIEDVTDNDMNDPEISAALKSFGWTEDDEDHGSGPSGQEEIKAKVLNLKKEALSQKRAGNIPEAMSLLKKAKLLEQDLGITESGTHTSELVFTQKIGDNQTSPPKSKMVVQKELLALKKKALILRREGRVEEADEELKKGKALEQQLEELENGLKKPATSKLGSKHTEPADARYIDPCSLDLAVDSAETDVTDHDMHDPSMLLALKNMGWNDDESDSLSMTKNASNPSNSHSMHESVPSTVTWKSALNKGEIQRELLAIKRKALSLRRQGKTEEAEEELVKAKELEKQLADLEESQNSVVTNQPERYNNHNAEDGSSRISDVGNQVSPCIETSKIGDTTKPTARLSISKLEPSKEVFSLSSESGHSDNMSLENSSSMTNKIDGYKEILAHKRNALALKKEGKVTEAKEELRKAKLLEKCIQDGQESSIDSPVSTSESTSIPEESSVAHVEKPKSIRDRFKLQQESLAHKRNALKLRREGKMQEAEAEFEKAKELENQLEELNAQGSGSSSSALDIGVVEDLLDPQLMSALKSIGWDDKDLSQPSIERVSDQSRIDRVHLEEQIRAIKIRALNLKRSGKQDEALEALRSAKKLEKKLDALT